MAENTKIQKALDKRNHLDFQAFSMLKRLLKMINYEPGKQQFLEIIAEYNGCNPEDMAPLLDEANNIIEAREEASEEFLKAVANIQD